MPDLHIPTHLAGFTVKKPSKRLGQLGDLCEAMLGGWHVGECPATQRSEGWVKSIAGWLPGGSAAGCRRSANNTGRFIGRVGDRARGHEDKKKRGRGKEDEMGEIVVKKERRRGRDNRKWKTEGEKDTASPSNDATRCNAQDILQMQ